MKDEPYGRPVVLVVMHDRLAPAGLVGLAVVEAGGRTTALIPHERYGSDRPNDLVDLPSDDHGFDALVVLGGAMHAGDDAGFPHFRPLLELIRRFHDRDKPVLGICLGAQLVGRAFGGRVRRQGFLELGFERVVLREAAAGDPVLRGLGPGFMAMQWHEDTVDLPEGAMHLGESEACRNQIFRLGRATYGFQGHIEATPDIVRSWVHSRAALLADLDPTLFARVERDLAQHMKKGVDLSRVIGARWLGLARSPGG